jgi:hypothetical protein
MTRRDYCGVCSEMVHDCDVICNECGVSLCYCCANCYDAISRIAIFHAKINVSYIKKITYGELNQFIKDIQSEEFISYVEKTYPDDNKYYIDTKCEFYEIQKKLVKIYGGIIENNLSDNSDKIVEFDIEYLIECCEYYCGLDEIIFICNMCHNNVKVMY